MADKLFGGADWPHEYRCMTCWDVMLVNSSGQARCSTHGGVKGMWVPQGTSLEELRQFKTHGVQAGMCYNPKTKGWSDVLVDANGRL